MESTEMVTKSLLKKSVSSNLNKSKKVTFSNTVKLFIDDPNKNANANPIEGTGMKWVEISIVDKSNDSLSPESYDECKVTDFLVHKVIYDNYVLPDNDEELDIPIEDNRSLSTSIVLESVSDDEGLEFVVHKVTEHEDDLIKQESDLDASIEENDFITPDLKTNEVLNKFSKLSVENILEHDKIIAFIDQRSLGLSALNQSINISGTGDVCNGKEIKEEYVMDGSSKKIDNSLVLSPPLQELSLEKIVKAHSDNILCELDISPLNSIQETDSDSDLSSEGTMIMMTSEECQKNEQHIRESFLQYQSRKEKMTCDGNTKSGVSDSENNFVPENECKIDIVDGPCENPEASMFEDKINFTAKNENTIKLDYTNFNASETTANTSVLHNSSSDCNASEPPPHKRTYSLSDTDAVFSQHNKLNPKCFSAMRRSSFDSAQFPVQPLTTVKIPSDVREWKILLDSLGKTSEENLSNEEQSVQSKDNINADGKSHVKHESNVLSDPLTTAPKPDELESFVHESTERVERIRRRYYINGKQHARFGNSRRSPVRGIRPRFGSTAEILQLMQKQNHPPIIAFGGTKNHMSWPCDETGCDSVLGKHNSPFYLSQSLSSECSSQSSIDSYCEDQLNTSSCDHYSISSCPSVIVHERGSPEGANPSKPPTEICDPTSEHSTIDSSDSYVYYSMKV